ncbi:hypothetical protein GCM10028862_01050 [Luteimonas pelagia]
MAERHREARRDRDRNRHDDAARLSREVQRERIERERDRARAYHRHLEHQQSLARLRAEQLQRARRLAQYRYQQDYYERLRRQQSLLASRQYDYWSDPYYYTPANYRYQRGGTYYSTNRYGADLLREAIRHGYREGIRAGRADRMDGWRPDYRNSWAYMDANYGYNGYYVSRFDYNHYFREGFRRGYDDGYYGRSRYGRHQQGQYSILEAILAVVLGLQQIG